MASKIEVNAHLATVRVKLRDVDNVRVLSSGDPTVTVDQGFRELDGDQTIPAALARQLTDEAQTRLKSEDVTVEVTWEPEECEVRAAIMIGETVADVDEFFDGVRKIRRRFPDHICDEVGRRLGRDIAKDDDHLEAGNGLLRIKAAADEKKAAAEKTAFTTADLMKLGSLTLVILLVATLAVIVGVNWLM
jgi:hypothetical protein